VLTIDPWFVDNLACPVDRGALRVDGESLRCASGHRYPVIDGVPIMLRPDVQSTIVLADASLQRAGGGSGDGRAPDLYLESLGISEDEKRGVLELASRGSRIDPVVAYLVAATNGLMYKHLIGALDSYPIPDLPLPAGQGRRFVDVGSSWGRWSIAAQRRRHQGLVRALQADAEESVDFDLRRSDMPGERIDQRPDRPVAHFEISRLAKGAAGLVIQAAHAEARRHLHARDARGLQHPAHFGNRQPGILVRKMLQHAV
jgi:uncharacterized protein YbaR (Trm112 family)